MRKYLFFVIFLSANYQSGYAQTSFQTRTATFLNNLNNFREVFGDQGYPMATAGDVTADDGIYASTSKLTAAKILQGPFVLVHSRVLPYRALDLPYQMMLSLKIFTLD
jgi:hypothetical protein